MATLSKRKRYSFSRSEFQHLMKEAAVIRSWNVMLSKKLPPSDNFFQRLLSSNMPFIIGFLFHKDVAMLQMTSLRMLQATYYKTSVIAYYRVNWYWLGEWKHCRFHFDFYKSAHPFRFFDDVEGITGSIASGNSRLNGYPFVLQRECSVCTGLFNH